MNKKIKKELVSVKIQSKTLKKLKILAARENMFMNEYLAVLVSRISIAWSSDDY